MKSYLWLRVAAGLLAFFGFAHTLGMLSAARNDEEAAVWQTMRSFKFEVMGTARTHWDFYFGLNIFLSVNLFLLAILVWQLSNLAKRSPEQARPFMLTLMVGLVAFSILGWTHFFMAPLIISVLALICVVMALFQSRKV